ncbi:DUF4202 domain-containing protein [Rhodospirillaceae bacterium AH-315-P19]|nr:DUF4202 domain-containing protein [Rhodospirillaceae bacterium AH-315-P19]
MTKNASRFKAAIAAIDAANAEDPNMCCHEGRNIPKALLYAIRMTERLGFFRPEASESLRLAARSQHIRRWEIPRSDYPMDRVGYLKWRTALKHFHAGLAKTLLEAAGYDAATIAHVQSLLLKEKLKQDAEAQALEDVICLVFLEHDFADFSKKHAEEKILGILRKTWKKMSPEAQKAALQLDLFPTARAQIEKALQSPG